MWSAEHEALGAFRTKDYRTLGAESETESAALQAVENMLRVVQCYRILNGDCFCMVPFELVALACSTERRLQTEVGHPVQLTDCRLFEEALRCRSHMPHRKPPIRTAVAEPDCRRGSPPVPRSNSQPSDRGKRRSATLLRPRRLQNLAKYDPSSNFRRPLMKPCSISRTPP